MQQFAHLKKITITVPKEANFTITEAGKTDGYDGHCLRAYSYFSDQMPDIINTVEGINSIEKFYPALRQESKAPTFLLTYGGTYHGLMKNCGLDEEVALQIESRYHQLYEESDVWVGKKLQLASKQGYIDVAFGHRVRCPILKQTVLNGSEATNIGKAESRTVGNALGQSYGLLNNRAAIEFRKRVLSSPHKFDILPIAHIHDAQYFMVKSTPECIEWFNTNLIECMEWQDLPELQHDKVKLGGEVSLFYPNWASEIKLPNNATKQEISDICRKSQSKKRPKK